MINEQHDAVARRMLITVALLHPTVCAGVTGEV